MNRRDALKATTVLTGAVVATATGALTACGREDARDASRDVAARKPTVSRVLSAGDQALAEEIADTLLPTTPASPGAKAAGAGAAINLLLSDCYEPAAQQRFVAGLQTFRQTCRDRRSGRDFTTLSPSEREGLLREIDVEARKAGETHYFGLLRELAERGYFATEVGMTKALRYVQTPGRWVGCMPLEPGQPAWG